MINDKIYLEVSEDGPDVAYLYLPGHPGTVKKTIRLCDIIKNYKGPDLYLDIDHEDNVIGIEILV